MQADCTTFELADTASELLERRSQRSRCARPYRRQRNAHPQLRRCWPTATNRTRRKERAARQCDLQASKTAAASSPACWKSVIEGRRVVTLAAEPPAPQWARCWATSCGHRAGAPAAMKVSRADRAGGGRNLEVGIGPDAEIFTRRRCSAGGTGADVGITRDRAEQPRPRCVAVNKPARRSARIGNASTCATRVGARSEGKAKDKTPRAPSAVHPPVRRPFGIDTCGASRCRSTSPGRTMASDEGASSLSKISAIRSTGGGDQRAHPTRRLMLFLGTVRADARPACPRPGFTPCRRSGEDSGHSSRAGDRVEHAHEAPRWTSASAR